MVYCSGIFFLVLVRCGNLYNSKFCFFYGGEIGYKYGVVFYMDVVMRWKCLFYIWVIYGFEIFW